MSCSICKHPKRPAIDQALLAGSATLSALSREYGLSTSALHRHKAHLLAKVGQAKDQLQENLRQGCFFWLTQALQMTMQTAQTAQADGNSRLVLQSLAQGTRLINIILKQDFQPSPEQVYQILTSPEWGRPDSLLPHDPQVLAVGRRALTGAFFSPCPENPGPIPASSPDLASQPAPAAASRPLREKSGKLPGKTVPAQGMNLNNISDALLYDIITMGGLPQPAKDLPLASRHAKVESLFRHRDHQDNIPDNKPLSEYLYEQSLKAGQEAELPEKTQPPAPWRPENGSGAPNSGA